MKKTTLLTLFLLSHFSSLNGQTFSDFLARLNSTPSGQRSALVDSFMSSVPAFPFVEQDTIANFIYRGSANSVAVAGDANGWSSSRSPLTRAAETDLWYRSEFYEPDARLEYKYVLNGSNWILDHKNANTALGGFGPNSELSMPAYIKPHEILHYPEIPHGTFQDTSFFSVNRQNSRTIRVYLPHSYQNSSRRYQMVLFHDGLDYISLAKSNNVLDYLIHQQRIEPIIAVFVPPVNRNEEYAGGLKDQFTKLVIDELIPWIDSRYRTIPTADMRAVMGASNGGNISLWLALKHSTTFGNVAAQSSNIERSISDGFQNAETLDLKIYMDLGAYDLPVLIPLVRNFVPIIESKGYMHLYNEYHEGHSWGFWRAHIDDALEMFFPSEPTSVEPEQELPHGFRLLQNFPNPFNPETKILFALENSAEISIQIYNTAGVKIRNLVESAAPPGSHAVTWDGRDRFGQLQPSGIYMVQLQVNGISMQNGRMVLLR